MDSSKEFLNPSSMLTPGLAGGMTMGITNSLAGQFQMVQPGTGMVGLALSFLFGLLVWVNQDVSHIKKFVLYVLNSLVIFVVAVGSNTVGTVSTGPAVASLASQASDLLMSSAVAQTQQQPGWCCVNGQVSPATLEQCSRASGRFAPKEDLARAACTKAGPAQAPAEGNKFFRPWLGQPRS